MRLPGCSNIFAVEPKQLYTSSPTSDRAARQGLGGVQGLVRRRGGGGAGELGRCWRVLAGLVQRGTLLLPLPLPAACCCVHLLLPACHAW